MLILTYSPQSDTNWLVKKLAHDDGHSILGTYWITKDDVYHGSIGNRSGIPKELPSEFTIGFIFAELHAEYFIVKREILGIEFDLFIHESVKLRQRDFTAVKNISIFRKISKIIRDKKLTIGGNPQETGWISDDDFCKLVARFPNQYELTKYVDARLSADLKDQFEFNDSYQAKYHDYLNKKLNAVRFSYISEEIYEYETKKYRDLLNYLVDMLNDENNYSEKQWQNEIVKFILLLFPKYIHAFTEAPVIDGFHGKTRSLDFMLLDYSGNVDILEIKKPFDKSLVTHSGYRDNYIPLRELSGTIMQIEKYIFNLMKSGKRGEVKLNNKYAGKLMPDFKIKVTNPKGMILSGRTNNMTKEQLNDFEVIKRKYSNIIDILSYDDLLMRFKRLIDRVQPEL